MIFVCVIVLYDSACDVNVNFTFNLNFTRCVTVKYFVVLMQTGTQQIEGE
jgi:hypothetical protein